MAKILKTSDADFQESLNHLSHDAAEMDQQVNEVVHEVLARVKAEGDAALLDYTNRFDRTNFQQATELKVSQEAIEKAYDGCDQKLRQALELAADRIRAYHEAIMPKEVVYTDDKGVKLGNRWSSIQKVGLYVPGGLAAYPSSVLMNAIPAQVAGVQDLIMVVPAPEGQLSDVVLAAAKIAGITEIYTIGGAQAVAALAYGTETIPAVDKIVGPGNAYVAAAKRQVFGVVGIDMMAGPSDILVVADDQNNPAWIAADLLSQAEHDPDARSVLIAGDQGFTDQVLAEVEKQLQALDREEIARSSWEQRGLVILTESIDEVPALVNQIAPEHLELAVAEPEKLLAKITNAGAIFLGRYTPEAIGDYVAGPSHVLPTGGTARFSSGLSVFDFLKRGSIIGCDEASFAALADATETLADAEGLFGHKNSVTVRK